jgi:hypothetical protein
MNIEIMRNTLYKAYLEDFYTFCKVLFELLLVASLCVDSIPRRSSILWFGSLERHDFSWESSSYCEWYFLWCSPISSQIATFRRSRLTDILHH